MIMADRRTVLVVDDDRNMLRLLQAFLRDNYLVRAVESGEEALSVLKSDDKPDLVLLDYLMPGMDGVETLSRIRDDEEIRDTAVFFLPGVAESAKINECMKLDPKGYILKPIGKLSLLAKLKEYFESI